MRMSNGYGGIIKLNGKRRKPYAVRVTVGWSENKKQKYKYIGYFETKKKALEHLVEFNQSSINISEYDITLHELWLKWKENHFEKIAANTQHSYEFCYKKLSPLYDKPFRSLKASDYQEIINDNKEYSGLFNLRNIVKMLYDYAIKNEIVTKDYSASLDLPKYKAKNKKTTFTKKEIMLLWSNQDDETVQILLILFYTGMRISELLQLETKNIDIESRIMIGGLKTENGIDRIIPIHKDIEHLIKNRMKGQQYLFQNKKQTFHSYNNFLKRYYTVKKRFNFERTIHETRHTFISQAKRLKMDDICLKLIVGHTLKDMTEHYTHKEPCELVNAIDLFNY